MQIKTIHHYVLVEKYYFFIWIGQWLLKYLIVEVSEHDFISETGIIQDGQIKGEKKNVEKIASKDQDEKKLKPQRG